MKEFVQTPMSRRWRSGPAPRVDIEMLVGSLLLGGVLLSMTLLIAGLMWHWTTTGRLGLDYTITGMNFFQFLLADLQQVAAEAFRPRLLVNLGLAVLMLTPYVRVLISMVYFAFVGRNWKYTLFTSFVLSVLTYSLFLR